jgi:hypothetical protein
MLMINLASSRTKPAPGIKIVSANGTTSPACAQEDNVAMKFPNSALPRHAREASGAQTSDWHAQRAQ